MWKKLSSKVIFEHPRLSLIEDEVVLPNGTKTTYLKYKDDNSCAATLIAKNTEGKILLQKEYSYPIGEKIFQLPGGHIPAGENIEDGANRELMEEAKLKSSNLKLLGSYLANNRRSTIKMHVFLATELEKGHLPSDPEEEFEDFWLWENEIDKLIRENKIINANALAAWAIYKNTKEIN